MVKEFAYCGGERMTFSHYSLIHIYPGVADFTIKAHFLHDCKLVNFQTKEYEKNTLVERA